MTDNDQQFDDLPEALIEALKGSDDVAIMTAKVDREIASLAAEHFSARRSVLKRFNPVWAAAAGLALVAVIIAQFRVVHHAPTPQLYSDVDGSGQVDIADVFALARDHGEFSQAELDAFAMQIVSLKAGSDST